MTNQDKSDGNRRWLLWGGIIIAVWLLGCLILAVGGGWWLGQRSAGEQAEAVVVAVTETATVAEIVLSTPEAQSTDIPVPTDTPQPTAAPTATDDPSLGDRLSLPTLTPTPIPEGVIVFLSSRNYDPQESCNRKHDLFAMNLDGSNQVAIDIPANPQQLGYYGLYPYF